MTGESDESDFQKAVHHMDRVLDLAQGYHDAGKKHDAQYWLSHGILFGIRELLIRTGEYEVENASRHTQVIRMMALSMGIEDDEEDAAPNA